jgi:hypothetical protein
MSMMNEDPTTDPHSQERTRGSQRHRGRRKERVLHTRVSEPLAEDIRRMAEDLRVPVSNLVRNVLEEAFSVVEAVSENVGELIDDVVDEAERTRDRIRHRRKNVRHRERRRSRHAARGEDLEHEPMPRQPFPQVVGWQPLILNQLKACADCEEPIEPGERGFAGMTAAGLGEIYLCRDCMDARH